jgi:hypothetical protein
LKQAPRSWYAKIDDYLRKVGCQRRKFGDTLYVPLQVKNLVILVMYVDDLIITGNNDDHILQVKEELQARFRMTNLGLLIICSQYSLKIYAKTKEKPLECSKTSS